MRTESIPEQETTTRLRLAIDLAREAGDLSLRYFRRPGLDVESKTDGSEVTQADREVERLIRGRLADAVPGDGVLGEEFEPVRSDNGWRWIIDPIDGTFSFVRGVPLYATLIAAERLGDDGETAAGSVQVGVILIPPLREMLHAARGGGAFLRIGDGAPVPARVSACRSLRDATVCTTSPDYFSADETRAALARVERAAGHMRGWSDAYAAVLLATGRCDALFEPSMNPWDAAPFEPIITEAGGLVTDWSGAATVHGRDLVASNGVIHDEFIRLLAP